jgi:Rab3 GTPase-activating protein catalytic subunit
MQQEGNIWLETWENAKPVPAQRQKRLFDDTREAEKAIQFLAQLKPGDAAQVQLFVIFSLQNTITKHVKLQTTAL